MNNKKLNRNRRFFVAIVVAAVYGMERLSLMETLRAVKMLLTSMLARRGTGSKLYYKRMRACWRCPVFYVPLRTCGSPLAEHSELGCWCAMERKARLPEATCWLDENTENEDNGWKTI